MADSVQQALMHYYYRDSSWESKQRKWENARQWRANNPERRKATLKRYHSTPRAVLLRKARYQAKKRGTTIVQQLRKLNAPEDIVQKYERLGR